MRLCGPSSSGRTERILSVFLSYFFVGFRYFWRCIRVSLCMMRRMNMCRWRHGCSLPIIPWCMCFCWGVWSVRCTRCWVPIIWGLHVIFCYRCSACRGALHFYYPISEEKRYRGWSILPACFILPFFRLLWCLHSARRRMPSLPRPCSCCWSVCWKWVLIGHAFLPQRDGCFSLL